MRTAILLLTTMALGTLLLAACGGNGDRDAPPAQTVVALEPTAVPPTPIPATAVPEPTPRPATAVPTLTPVPPTKAPTATPQVFEGDLFLHLELPEELEVLTTEPTLEVVGRTRVDAVVTINDTLVEPDIDGRFSLNVDLEEGPNIIEVVVSVASGDQKDLVLVAIYIP